MGAPSKKMEPRSGAIAPAMMLNKVVLPAPFGPILGAFLLTGLSETMQNLLAASGLDLPGAKQVIYGVCLLAVVVMLPDGVWPWLATRIGVSRKQP